MASHGQLTALVRAGGNNAYAGIVMERCVHRAASGKRRSLLGEVDNIAVAAIILARFNLQLLLDDLDNDFQLIIFNDRQMSYSCENSPNT